MKQLNIFMQNEEESYNMVTHLGVIVALCSAIVWVVYPKALKPDTG
jgi:hypothetical protein